MIRTGRLNSLSLGIIFVRDLTMDRKSSFKRKKRSGRWVWRRTVDTAAARTHV